MFYCCSSNDVLSHCALHFGSGSTAQKEVGNQKAPNRHYVISHTVLDVETTII